MCSEIFLLLSNCLSFPKYRENTARLGESLIINSFLLFFSVFLQIFLSLENNFQ
ncbi:hypothetical protein LMOh7858_0492 [Listeria monocytogenes str. 4b H7858]|nr:hypothetical protein LMOh7858_0492 [Listeria monocytogenes str. 4b H7858] [Listeria monocytogenes serotype 4b str. H7858]